MVSTTCWLQLIRNNNDKRTLSVNETESTQADARGTPSSFSVKDQFQSRSSFSANRKSPAEANGYGWFATIRTKELFLWANLRTNNSDAPPQNTVTFPIEVNLKVDYNWNQIFHSYANAKVLKLKQKVILSVSHCSKKETEGVWSR